jgi:hypothetical protein
VEKMPENRGSENSSDALNKGDIALPSTPEPRKPDSLKTNTIN